MEGNPGSLSPDLKDMVVEEVHRNGLTCSNSESFVVTGDYRSKNVSVHNANAKRGGFIEWTDEKHSLYLYSLESSFTTQLHHSMGMRPTKNYISSDQKINFKKSEPLLDSTADSHAFLRSPWIRHYRSVGKPAKSSSDSQDKSSLFNDGSCIKGSMTSSIGVEESSEDNHVLHSYQELIGSVTEVSDQNYMDQDQIKSSSAPKEKRLKETSSDASDKDQVVPSWKFVSLEGGEEHNVNCSQYTQTPESFISP